MKEDEAKKQTPRGSHRVVPRPAVPADYLKARPKVYLKSGEKDDIGLVWAEQARIRDEEEALEREYLETKAKQKALKDKIKKNNQVGDPLKLGAILPPEAHKVMKKTKNQAIVALSKSKTKLVTAAKPAAKLVKTKHLIMAIASIALVGTTAILISNNSDKPKVTSSNGTVIAGATDEKPSFTILYPSGKEFKTARVSPEGAAPAYAFIDTVEGAQINVSQQELPPALKSNSSGELAKLAKEFQATSTIQIDDTTVYHGLNDKTGIQSLLLIKNGLLVLIRADRQLQDDQWAGYISALK